MEEVEEVGGGPPGADGAPGLLALALVAGAAVEALQLREVGEGAALLGRLGHLLLLLAGGVLALAVLLEGQVPLLLAGAVLLCLLQQLLQGQGFVLKLLFYPKYFTSNSCQWYFEQ